LALTRVRARGRAGEIRSGIDLHGSGSAALELRQVLASAESRQILPPPGRGLVDLAARADAATFLDRSELGPTAAKCTLSRVGLLEAHIR